MNMLGENEKGLRQIERTQSTSGLVYLLMEAFLSFIAGEHLDPNPGREQDGETESSSSRHLHKSNNKHVCLSL